ncbi:MAG: histidine kinase [Gemmatimonadetes bacterium]|nr:histidine kinase [Gemmatimonadota bacterium]
MSTSAAGTTRQFLLNRWTAVGVTCFLALDIAREVLVSTTRPPNAPWGVLLFHNVAWWIPWLLIVPVVGAVSRRWSVLGPRRSRAIVAHVALAFVATVVHVVAVALLMALAPPAPGRWPGVLPVAANLLAGYVILNLLTYLAVASIWHAVDSSREVTRRVEEGRALALRTRELEHELTGATLEALRAQLNPHFLFNALNAIAGLVRGGDRERAVSAIAQLGDLLRETLDKDAAQEVPLADEVALVRRYLAIEEMRLAQRLQVVVEVAPGVAHLRVPSFLLQPLVENAIRHGIARWPEGGTVTIEAQQFGPQLTVSVRDTPRQPRPTLPGAPLREGIGLGNTRRRLQQLYGGRATLRVALRADGGCVAEVVLPVDAAVL